MAKYTKEELEKAIDLYIRYCRQAAKVKFITLSQLGHKAAGCEGDGADREGSWRLQGPGPSHH